jgi:hypothetical protein
MIISVLSPHAPRSGNTVSSIFLGMGLGDLKRKTLITHVKPLSKPFDHYLGLRSYEDKTTTPAQLAKLMREGAIKPEEITDYCKTVDDYLDVFTNSETNFSEEDMATLLKFLVKSETNYEYTLVDIDESVDHETTQMVLSSSSIVVLNVPPDALELAKFSEDKEKIMKMCKGKKVIMLCSAYDTKSFKSTKDIAKALGVDTTIYTIRHNLWVKWGCNNGKLGYVYKQGKIKDADVIEVFRDTSSLASAVAKAKVAINKSLKGVNK